MSAIQFEYGKVSDIKLSIQLDHDHECDNSVLITHGDYTLTLVGAITMLELDEGEWWFKGKEVVEYLQNEFDIEESTIIAWLEGTVDLPIIDQHFQVFSKPFIEWTDKCGATIGDLLDEFYEDRQANIDVLEELLGD